MAKAAFGSVIKMHYQGKSENGRIFDQSEADEPLVFVIGNGDIIEGLEDAVIGMEPGEKKSITVPPEKAYGPHDATQVATIERTEFPESFPLQVGQRLRIPKNDGTTLEATVTELNDSHVTLDGNHPFAKETVNFEVEVIAVD